MTVESVEKLMDETAEAQAYQRVRIQKKDLQQPRKRLTHDPILLQEIDEAVASKMTAEDEEAVALEMEQLEKEAMGNLEGTAPKVGIQVRIQFTLALKSSPFLFANITAFYNDSPLPRSIYLLLLRIYQWVNQHQK